MSEVERLLESVRSGLTRLTPQDAHDAAKGGALLVDTRTAKQRARQGEVPDALVIDRTVLEWRLDPTCPHRIPEATPGTRVIVLCRQGYSSSLAAASLRSLGVDATDVIGGVEDWLAAGLPLHDGAADIRE